jgi:hypothetical protein
MSRTRLVFECDQDVLTGINEQFLRRGMQNKPAKEKAKYILDMMINNVTYNPMVTPIPSPTQLQPEITGLIAMFQNQFKEQAEINAEILSKISKLKSINEAISSVNDEPDTTTPPNVSNVYEKSSKAAIEECNNYTYKAQSLNTRLSAVVPTLTYELHKSYLSETTSVTNDVSIGIRDNKNKIKDLIDKYEYELRQLMSKFISNSILVSHITIHDDRFYRYLNSRYKAQYGADSTLTSICDLTLIELYDLLILLPVNTIVKDESYPPRSPHWWLKNLYSSIYGIIWSNGNEFTII